MRVEEKKRCRVRKLFNFVSEKKSPESSRANLVLFLPPYEPCYTGAENPVRKQERHRHDVPVSLSLPTSSPSPPIPFPRSRASFPPKAQPRWRGGLALEVAGVRPPARGAGSASPSVASVPIPPVSPRQFRDPLPATRVAGKSGPACWRCGDPGHFIDRCTVMEVGTLVRVPDAPQAAPDQAGMYQIPVSIKGVLIGLWWIQDVTKPRSIKA